MAMTHCLDLLLFKNEMQSFLVLLERENCKKMHSKPMITFLHDLYKKRFVITYEAINIISYSN